MKLKLIAKKKEIGNVKTFIFKPEAGFSWKAGQYLIYNLEHENKDLRGKMRFFTISSPPFLKTPSITTRIFDKPSSFKKALNKLRIGDSIEAKGPDGDFVINGKSKGYVFIAGGIGITPFYSIIMQLVHEKKDFDILLLYQNKNKNVVFKNELDSLMLKKFKVEYLIDKRIDEVKIKSIKRFRSKKFYVSGPDPMVELIENTLDKLGVPKKNQYFDYFSGYKNI